MHGKPVEGYWTLDRGIAIQDLSRLCSPHCLELTAVLCMSHEETENNVGRGGFLQLSNEFLYQRPVVQSN